MTLTSRKCRGTSVTVDSLVAATTLRVVAGAVGGDCAAEKGAAAVVASRASPNVKKRTMTSRFNLIWLYSSEYYIRVNTAILPILP